MNGVAHGTVGWLVDVDDETVDGVVDDEEDAVDDVVDVVVDAVDVVDEAVDGTVVVVVELPVVVESKTQLALLMRYWSVPGWSNVLTSVRSVSATCNQHVLSTLLKSTATQLD